MFSYSYEFARIFHVQEVWGQVGLRLGLGLESRLGLGLELRLRYHQRSWAVPEMQIDIFHILIHGSDHLTVLRERVVII